MSDINQNNNNTNEQSNNQSTRREMLDGIMNDMFSRYQDTFTELAKGPDEPSKFDKKED